MPRPRQPCRRPPSPRQSDECLKPRSALRCAAAPPLCLMRSQLKHSVRVQRLPRVEQQSMELVWPTEQHLGSYADALRRGWSADTQRAAAGAEELARIEENPSAFLASQIDPEGRGPPVTLPDGSIVPRLPSYRLWMWDGEFCGSISLRWQPGTTDLPPHCLGHIGYSVVPWKRRRGHATRALALILPLAGQQGLPFVELTTDVANVPSQRVIIHNGGQLVERFHKPASHGGAAALRFRIQLLRWLQANDRGA